MQQFTVALIVALLINALAIAQKSNTAAKRNTYSNSGKGQQYNNTGRGTQKIYNIRKGGGLTKEEKRQLSLTAKYVEDRLKFDSITKKIETEFGDISDTKDAVIFPEVQIGRSGTIFLLVDGTFGLPVFGPEPIFQLYIKDKRLHFWGVIREETGGPIAAIEDNTWTIYDKTHYEYNNNDTAFEVVTKGEREVIFQINYVGGKVRLVGFLINKEKKGLYFYDSPDPATNGARLCYINPDKAYKVNGDPELILEKNRLFKYPRGKYLGEQKDDYH